MILHTLNKSPFTHRNLERTSSLIAVHDALLLLEDGVYAVHHELINDLLASGVKVYAVEADISARGLLTSVPSSIPVIGYEAFVTLCCDYDKQRAC